MEVNNAKTNSITTAPVPEVQATIAQDLPRPSSLAFDTSAFVHLPDALRDLAGAASRYTPWQADEPADAASSSRNDVDFFARSVQQHGEKLVELRRYASSFLRRYNNFAYLRTNILELRSRMKFEWMVGADHLRFVAESQDRFLHEATLLSESLGPDFSTSKLLTAHAQVTRDHKRQAERLLRTYDIETQLSKSEYDLQQKEFRSVQAASKILEILDELDPPDVPDHGESQPSTRPSIALEETTPPLVEYYFDKVGDVGLARDRLTELELEHREEREQRGFLEDQGTPLSVSEAEFEERFSKHLEEAETALAEAIRRADNAKQVCNDDNIDPELYRNRLRPDPTGTSERSISDEEDWARPESPLPPATPNGNMSPYLLPVGQRVFSRGPPQDPLSTTVRDPVDLILPESLSLQDTPFNQLRQDQSGREDRIKHWIDDVKPGDDENVDE